MWWCSFTYCDTILMSLFWRKIHASPVGYVYCHWSKAVWNLSQPSNRDRVFDLFLCHHNMTCSSFIKSYHSINAQDWLSNVGFAFQCCNSSRFMRSIFSLCHWHSRSPTLPRNLSESIKSQISFVLSIMWPCWFTVNPQCIRETFGLTRRKDIQFFLSEGVGIGCRCLKACTRIILLNPRRDMKHPVYCWSSDMCYWKFCAHNKRVVII